MRRLDPAALAFHAIALAVAVTLCVILFFMVRSDPPAPEAGRGLPAMVERAKKSIEEFVRPGKRADPVTGPGRPSLPVGRVWLYNVSLEPPHWRDAVLAYRTVGVQGDVAVYTEFSHAAGKTNFQLGTFAANHPSHANVRFPGFFMYAAYLDKPLEVGQRFAWEWPWQMPGGKVRAGRVKRWEGEMKGWENVAAPVGTHRAARIETVLSYIEDGKVRGRAKETLWYAPGLQQFIRVVREGATPDEGAQRIVAELARLD